jgi:hypothetical protein
MNKIKLQYIVVGRRINRLHRRKMREGMKERRREGMREKIGEGIRKRMG